jgi:hypothetical protein
MCARFTNDDLSLWFGENASQICNDYGRDCVSRDQEKWPGGLFKGSDKNGARHLSLKFHCYQHGYEIGDIVLDEQSTR